MKRFYIILTFLVLSLSLYSPVASAAVVTPQEGASFNNPKGTTAEQMALTTRINNAIDATPAGSVIRLTAYSISETTTTAKLIQAHKRGVDVRVIIDDHVVTLQMKQLQAALGTTKTKPSFIFMCKESCMADTGMMHAKLFMFSRAGSATHITMVASFNPTPTGEKISWNDMYTVVGNIPIYNSFAQYFSDMLLDKTTANYYRTTTDDKYKAFFYPQAWNNDPSDTILQSLSGVQCTGTGAGYGSDGRTVIKIAMFRWSNARIKIAQRLWDLDNQGCIVQVITNKQYVETDVVAALIKPGGKYGGVNLFNGQYDANHNGIPETYVHHKYMIINGVYAGNNKSKITLMGSICWEGSPQRDSNEVMLKITDAATYNAFTNNFSLIRDHYAYPMKTVPAGAVSPDLAGSYGGDDYDD